LGEKGGKAKGVTKGPDDLMNHTRRRGKTFEKRNFLERL